MYELMLKFGANMLSDLFMKQYIFEYGEQKFQKIVRIVNTSQKITDYINNVVNSSITPSPEGLQKLLNSHSYFLFAKEETICIGCLGVVTKWESEIFEGFSIENDELLTELKAKLILHCYKLKYNQSDNTFNRFFKKLREIDMSADD